MAKSTVQFTKDNEYYMEKIIIVALYKYREMLIKQIYKSEREIEKLTNKKDTFTSNAKITSSSAKTQNKMNVLFDIIKDNNERIDKIEEYLSDK